MSEEDARVQALTASARTLIDGATLDAGAASVAAAANDYQIAYELLQDALSSWQRAADALWQIVESPAGPGPATSVPAVRRTTPVADLVVPDDDLEVALTPTVDSDELSRPMATVAASVGVPEVVTPPAPDSTIDLDHPEHERHGLFRRRRRAQDEVHTDEGTVVLDEILADYVHDEADDDVAAYDEWVTRLQQKRHELKRSAAESDGRLLPRVDRPVEADEVRWR